MSKSKDDDMPSVGLRPFGKMLGEIGGGDFERTLTNDYAELVRAVRQTHKAGKLTITIAVGEDGKMIRVVGSSKSTIPRPAVEATAFFDQPDGSLHHENPRQTKMAFQPKIAGNGNDDNQ